MSPRYLEGPYPFRLSQVSCSKLMAFPEALYLVIEALDESAQRRWRVAVEVRYTCLVGLRRSLASSLSDLGLSYCGKAVLALFSAILRHTNHYSPQNCRKNDSKRTFPRYGCPSPTGC